MSNGNSRNGHDDGLRTTAQLTVYRNRGGKIEYLFLKHQEDKEHSDYLWQPIAQSIEHEDADMTELLTTAATEQAGIDNLVYLSDELSEYEWYADDRSGRDIVYAAEVDDQAAIFPDLEHYSNFEWLPFNMALSRLRWSGSKTSLRNLQADLEERLAPTDDNEDKSDEVAEPTETEQIEETGQPAQDRPHPEHHSGISKAQRLSDDKLPLMPRGLKSSSDDMPL